jgi:hypothetical protein
MSTGAIRYLNRHRPAPMREAFVLRCKNSAYSSSTEQRNERSCFKMDHLIDVFVMQSSLIVISNVTVTTQISIVRSNY